MSCQCGHGTDNHFGYLNTKTNKNMTVCENCSCKSFEIKDNHDDEIQCEFCSSWTTNTFLCEECDNNKERVLFEH